MRIRLIVSILIMPLPWIIRRIILVRIFGYSFGDRSYVGRSILDANKVTLGVDACIGSLTAIRNLDELILKDRARIGSFNWIFGYLGHEHFKGATNRKSRLILGDDSAVVARHIIDCTDEVSFGEFSTLAGHRSQILTHSIDIKQNIQTCAPIVIGRYSFVGTGCILTKGAVLPGYSVVGAGSVVTNKTGGQEYSLYVGNPAGIVKQLDPESKYFKRKKGVVR